ncbi:8134_t:CDS:1, partial [Gigaspora rosea]
FSYAEPPQTKSAQFLSNVWSTILPDNVENFIRNIKPLAEYQNGSWSP